MGSHALREPAALALAVAGWALVLSTGAAVAADGPKLPAFGANRFHAAILASTSAPDVDDYVAPLVKGEKVGVTVTADKKSALLPRLTFVNPDGVEFVPVPLVPKSKGKVLALVNYLVPQTGRWTARVGGENATEGGYGVTFKITAAPALKPKALQTVTPEGIAFEAVDGALLDFTITWKDAAAAIRVGSITGPDGQPLVYSQSGVGKKSLTVRKFPLHGGDGTYALHLTTLVPDATFKLNLKVTPQGRPRAGKVIQLTPEEPALDPVAAPIRGIAGTAVRFAGKNFSAKSPPSVLFNGLAGVVTVLDGGATLSVVPPAVLEGTTVDVVVIAQDGQFVAADDYFHYATTPSVVGLLDGANLAVDHGPVAGGATVSLIGGGFEAGQTVWFGTSAATVLAVTNAGRLSVQVPAASSPGAVAVFVEDEFGRTSATSLAYTYQ